MEGGERKALKMDVTCLPREIGNEAIKKEQGIDLNIIQLEKPSTEK